MVINRKHIGKCESHLCKEISARLPTGSKPAAWSARFKEALHCWIRARWIRREFEALLERYDDRLLRDIGVSRYDLAREANRLHLLSCARNTLSRQ